MKIIRANSLIELDKMIEDLKPKAVRVFQVRKKEYEFLGYFFF